MEGFLYKKSRGEKTFMAMNSWQKRWFVVEGPYMFYFESFDPRQDQAVNKKGVIPLKDSVVQETRVPDRKYCFIIKHPNRMQLVLEAESEPLRKAWIEAITQASKENFGQDDVPVRHPVRESMPRYLELLGLPPTDEPDQQMIYKAYKKKALKAHPDKGGDPKVFEDIREAYELLTQMLKDEENELKYDWIEYDADIIKGPQGQGLGVVVSENKQKKYLEVKQVMDCIRVVSISANAGGAVKAGDVLIRIGKDDISKWPLRRVVQRVGEFRAPTGKPIRMGFRRKVLKPGFVEEDEAAAGAEGEPMTPESPTGGASPRSAFSRQDTVFDDGAFADGEEIFIGEGIPSRRRMLFLESMADDDFRDMDLGDSSYSGSQTPASVASPRSSSPTRASSRRPDAASDLRLEDLKKKVSTLTKEKGQLEQDLADVRKTLTYLRRENEALESCKAETRSLKATVRKLEEEKSSLQTQWEQSKSRGDTLQAEMQRVLLNAEAYFMRRTGQTNKASTGGPEALLELAGLANQAVHVEVVQRNAIASAAAADPSVVRKWAQSGEGPSDKLHRFEQKLKDAGLVVSAS